MIDGDVGVVAFRSYVTRLKPLWLAGACSNWAGHMKLSCMEISTGIPKTMHIYRRFPTDCTRYAIMSKRGIQVMRSCRNAASRMPPAGRRRRPRPRATTTRLFRPDNYSAPSTRSSTDRVRPWIILLRLYCFEAALLSRVSVFSFSPLESPSPQLTHTIRAQLASTHPNPSNNN